MDFCDALNKMDNSEKDFPLISICIPVFNGGDLIYRALESCVHQTYKKIEIIIADNNSSDDTEEVVKKYIARDKRIKYFKQNENIGPTKNFLSAFEFASGDFIQLLAHDDWLSRGYINECVKSFLAHPKAATIVGGLISLVISKNRFFNFDREIVFDSKEYPVQHFLGDLQNNQMTSLIIYSMARKQDLIEAAQLSSKIFDTPSIELSEETQKLHKKGFGIDIVISQKLLSKYDYFFFNNKIRYIKIDHPTNTGKTAGIEVDMQNAKGIVNNYFYFLLCNEYLYSTLFKKYLFKLRVTIGVDLLVTLLFRSVQFRFRSAYFSGLTSKNTGDFFKNYTFLEKLCVVMTIVPTLILRLFRATLRKSTKQTLPPFREEYFLSPKGEFVA